MQIRKTKTSDVPDVLEMLNHGRSIIRDTGNTVQWTGEYPGKIDIEQDIQQDVSFICIATEADANANVQPGTPLATVAVMTAPEPTYQTIDGQWLNDEPYATIHRIATNGRVKGAGRFCIEWVLEHYDNVRIDTHEANKPMLYLIEQLGFQYCGQVIVHDGTPRMAFQKLRNKA